MNVKDRNTEIQLARPSHVLREVNQLIKSNNPANYPEFNQINDWMKIYDNTEPLNDIIATELNVELWRKARRENDPRFLDKDEWFTIWTAWQYELKCKKEFEGYTFDEFELFIKSNYLNN